MKISISITISFSILLLSSCIGQEDKLTEPKKPIKPVAYTDADIVTSSIVDENGDLWFGTSTEGLYKYNGEEFANYNEDNGLCTNQIWDILEDNNGIIWLATNKGLCTYDGETFSQITLPFIDTSSEWYKSLYPVVNPNQASTIIQDRNGVFWVGTSGGGAYKYDGESFESVMTEGGRLYNDSLHHNVIQCILEDENGVIWFASMSRGGITSFDGTNFTHIGIEDGLSDNMIRHMYQDKESNIWIGTNGNMNGGIDVFDGDTLVNFTKEDGLCSNNISIIYQSSDGKIWLGSDREALCYYENGEFTSFDQLSHIAIRTIIEDKQGNMWFGGRKGSLWKYDGEKLTDFTQLKNNL